MSSNVRCLRSFGHRKRKKPSFRGLALFPKGLPTIDGVLSTATHFLLRSYKEHGHLLSDEGENPEKPAVSA
jgi:hypothetical protein